MKLNTALGGVIFLVAQTGILFNLAVVVLSSKTIAFSNPFGLLVRNEAFGSLMFSAVFGFYVAPAIIFDITSWQRHAVSAHLGHVAVLSHDIGLFSHFCVSVNRFVATNLPTRYNKMFTYRSTTKLVVFVNVTAFIITFVHIFEQCWLFFDFDLVNFVYDYSQNCSRILALNIQFPRYVIINILCFVIDLFTFIRIKIINRKQNSLSGLDRDEYLRRQKMKNDLITQVTVQAFVGITEVFTYFIVSPHFTNRIVVFLLTTLAWQMINTADGVLIFIFNRELRRVFKQYMAIERVFRSRVADQAAQ